MNTDPFHNSVTVFNCQQVQRLLNPLADHFDTDSNSLLVKENQLINDLLLSLKQEFKNIIEEAYKEKDISGQGFVIAVRKNGEMKCTFFSYESLKSLIEKFSSKNGDDNNLFGKGCLDILNFLKLNSTEESKNRCIVLLLDINLIMDYEYVDCSEIVNSYN